MVLYVQRGPDGAPEVLIDPNTLSKDGTVRLGATALSPDGKYFGYGVSNGGSDWQEYHVMETATRRQLDDRIQWVKVSGLAWYGEGFFYSRYDAPTVAAKALSQENENQRVYYHRLGTAQSQDELVFEDLAHPWRFHRVDVTDDQRWLVLSISDRSVAGNDGNELWVRDLSRGEKTFRPVVRGFIDRYDLIDNVGDRLLVLTNRHAPNSRVIEIDPARPEEVDRREVIPERAEQLASAPTSALSPARKCSWTSRARKARWRTWRPVSGSASAW